MLKQSKRKLKQSGTALIVGTVSMVLVVPMIGLAVDVGILYALKAQLQASVDGASLAAARALSLSASTASQVSDAQHNANNWFYSNFPNTYWGATSTDMAPDDTHVHVYDDASNPHLRHVDVTAAIDAPNYFMRWFGSPTTHVVAKGFASRRDVVAMMVLDRSGSMCADSGPPCTSSDSGCGGLIDAAKLFAGQFTVGRDKIGAISFADNAYLHSVPTTNFRTALGFDTSVGATGSNTGAGELDTIACGGGTNTASAVAQAYNELYKVAEPGALNIIVFETDGHPNTITVNFADINYGTNTLNGVALSSSSGCLDQNNKTKGAGGFATYASIPAWQGNPSHDLNTLASGQTTAPYYSSTQPGPSFYTSDVPAGMIGALGGTDAGSTAYLLFKSWTTSKSNTYQETSGQYVTAATGCNFSGSPNTLTDFSWLPTTDVYGNNLNTSYDTVTTASVSGGTRISPVNMSQIRAAAFNAVDDAAHRFRTNATIPVTFYAVGFNSADTTLMQRVANDPGWIGNASCTAQCQYDSTQPTGKYVYAATTSALSGAFQSLASQILRLAQ